MTTYSVIVQETVCVTYDAVKITAASEAEAEQLAEEMRKEGLLGLPTEAVEAVDFDIEEGG